MKTVDQFSEDWQPKDEFPRGYRSGIRLNDLARQLAEIIAATEEEFLALGAHLGNFHHQARQTARRAEQVSDSLPEGIASDIGARLQTLLRRLEQHRFEQERTCAGGQLLIEQIRHQLERLEEPLAAFRRIVKTMHSLAIAIRIESSGGERGSGAAPLADELKELATLVGARSAVVCNRLAGLDGNCSRAWKRLDELQVGQDGVSNVLLQQAERTLERLVASTCEATREAGRISSSAISFAKEIEEVVASIQFQDIVRQKVLHIRRALVDADQETIAAGEICSLQAEHLRLAREEMLQAGRRIVDNLRLLAARIESTPVAETFGLCQEESVFRQMEAVIAELTLLLQSGVMGRQQAAEAIDAVRDSVQLMESLLGEIDLLGEKMKVLALNAAIRAVHGGQEGAALAVIANAIQQLAGEALAQTRALENGFRQIMVKAGSLDTAEQSGGTPAELCAEATLLLTHLQGINSDQVSGVRQAEAAALCLAEEIRQVAEGLRAHEEFAEGAQAIEEILRQEARQHGAENRGGGGTVFEEIYSRYTMQSERQIHKGQLPGAKIIDLEQHRAARRGSELGENVELF